MEYWLCVDDSSVIISEMSWVQIQRLYNYHKMKLMEILAVSEVLKNLVLSVSYGIPKMAVFANFVKLHFLRTSSKRFKKKKQTV